MNKEAKLILVTVALCLSGGLLAMNLTHGPAAKVGTTFPAPTPVSFANSVFTLAESVEWSQIDSEPMWPTF
jgi:hypothetical protein